MGASIYLTVTAMDVGDRHALSDKIVETVGGLRDVGGGTGFGEDAESDMDFETAVSDPTALSELALAIWLLAGELTGGAVIVKRIAIVPERK